MRWNIDRLVSLLAGSFTLFSLALGRLHHRRWRLMTVAIGANLLLRATVGWCPASLIMRRLGVPEAWEAREQGACGADAVVTSAPADADATREKTETLLTAR